MNTMHATATQPSLAKKIQRATASARFFTASLLVHIGLIIVAGSAVMFHQVEQTPDFLAPEGGLLTDTPAVSGPQEEKVAAPELKPPAPAAAGASSSGIDAIATASALNSSFQIGTVPNNEINLGKAVGAAGDAMAKALADGVDKIGAGMARAGGTSMVKFFGKATQVRAVVFVVDISGSMISGEKSAKTYDDLEDEVKRVIRGLDKQTLFGIVAFSGDAFLYRNSLVAATNDEKQRAINWLKKQSPVEGAKSDDQEEKKKHHGTRADRGLEAAFKLQADTIFFVSDGEPTGSTPPQVLKMVEELQKGRPKPAVINAVAYLADSGQKFMQDLATKTGGSFREINPKDARKN